MRIVLFGSFYRGFFVLNELLFGPLRKQVQVVGVATDDPTQTFVSPGKRVWQYPHTRQEELMVGDLAREQGIPVYHGKVKTPEFYELFEQEWKPDLCLMATFGQKINERLFEFPEQGFYNFHPSDEGCWPSRYAGGNPFQQLIDDRARYCVITMHQVDAGLDTGKLISISERISIPPNSCVIDMHKISSPIVALLAREQIGKMLEKPVIRALGV